MAIRFPCPSCRQPIEIDDEWAGQPVGCPYCRKAVQAPAQSQWPPSDIPVATPVQGGLRQPPPPPPPHGYPPLNTDVASPHGRPRASAASANWALLLAVGCAVLSIIGVMIWVGTIGEVVFEEVGENATQQELQQALQKLIASNALPGDPAATAVLFVGVCAGIVALVLGIRSIIRQEGHTGRAIAASLISAVFVCCQCVMMLVIMQHQAPGA